MYCLYPKSFVFQHVKYDVYKKKQMTLFYKNNLNENPFGAIITFLNKYKNNIEIILITNQIIIKKNS